MKKIIAFLLVTALFVSVSSVNVRAVEKEFVNIMVELNGQEKVYKVIKNGNELMFDGESLAEFGTFNYGIEGDDVYFSRGAKTVRVNISNNKLYPFENFGSHIEEDLSVNVYKVNGKYYFPGSEVIPWLNITCSVDDGRLCIFTDEVSLWDLIPIFEPDNFAFDFINCCYQVGVDNKYLKSVAYFHGKGLSGVFWDFIPVLGTYVEYMNLYQSIIQDKSSVSPTVEELIDGSKKIDYWLSIVEKADPEADYPDEIKAIHAFAKSLKTLSGGIELAMYFSAIQEHNENVINAFLSMEVNGSLHGFSEEGQTALTAIRHDYEDFSDAIERKIALVSTELILDLLQDKATGMLNVALEVLGLAEVTSPTWSEGINCMDKYKEISEYCLSVYNDSKEDTWESSVRDIRSMAFMYLYANEQNWRTMADYAKEKGLLDLFEHYTNIADSAEEWQGKFLATSIAEVNDSHEAKTEKTKELKKIFNNVKTEEIKTNSDITEFSDEELTFIRTVLSAISGREFYSIDNLSNETIVNIMIDMIQASSLSKDALDYIPYDVISESMNEPEYKVKKSDFDISCNYIFGKEISKEEIYLIKPDIVFDDYYQITVISAFRQRIEIEIKSIENINEQIVVNYAFRFLDTDGLTLKTVNYYESVFTRNSSDDYPFKIVSQKEINYDDLYSTLLIDKIRQSFVNAGKVYSKWRYPDVSETDIIENADAVYGAYYAVQENVSSIDDLHLEIKEYFTDEACDELIGDHYIERNGKLYFDRWPFGIEDTLYVLNDELTNTDDGLIYKVYFKIVDHMGNAVEDVFEMKIISDNHKYIFEDYGIFFSRLSGEINKLYLKGESYPTNKEINNMAIKTAYKHLTNSLHAYNDQYSEYMIYDMDQDGTTELIYMKGTCMADLKTHYYTYEDGNVIKLGETYDHIKYRTESGKGIYTYWSRMQGEVLCIVKKTGDKIVKEIIFDNYGDPTVEGCSLPDDKYLLETFQYNDHTGIERLAISN